MNPLERNPSPFIEVEGVRFYGNPEGAPTEEEIQNLQLTPSGEMHLLRHFSRLSEEARARIMGIKLNPGTERETVVSQEYLDEQLKTGGAKFNPEQAAIDDPQKMRGVAMKLLQLGSPAGTPQWVRRGNQKRLIFRVTLTSELKNELGLDQKKPLGFGNLVEITDETKEAVFQKPRGKNETSDQIERNFIRMAQAPTTDGLVVALTKFDNQEYPQIAAVHPGIIAAPMPNKRSQSEEEFNYNQAFWSRHAFVET